MDRGGRMMITKKILAMGIDLEKYCKFDNIIYFYRVHTFQAALEALLSFYLMQMWIVFTPIVSDTQLCVKNGQFIEFIISTLAMGLAVYLLYMIVLYLFFSSMIAKVTEKIEKYDNFYKAYEKVHNRFKRASITMHCVGTTAYGLVSFLTVKIYSYVKKESVTDDRYIMIVIIGVVIGILWNCQDYFADMRIDWSRVVKKLEKLKEKNENNFYTGIFNNTMRHGYLSFLIVVVAIFSVVSLAFNVVWESDIAKGLVDGNFLQNAYVLIGLTILTMYIKTVFSLYYKGENSEGSKKSLIYPSVAEMLRESRDLKKVMMNKKSK